MLGHDKAACDSLKSSLILSPNTTPSPSTESIRRSSSPPAEDSEGPSRFPSGDPTLHSGDPTLFLRLLRNLPASRNVFVFEDITGALSFQTEAHKLRFHSALQVYCSPDVSKASPIFVVIGESKEDVSDALQACLRPISHITSALWPHAA
jgi:hypothetical protein